MRRVARITHGGLSSTRQPLALRPHKQIKGRRKTDYLERILLSKIFRGPFRGHTWSTETNSFPSDSDSSLLFRPVSSHDIHRTNRF